MAGGINLTPYLPVIIGQGVIFSLAYGVVHAWIITPYHKLRTRRESLTSGVLHDVSDVSAQILQRRQQMESGLHAAYDEVRQLREEAKVEAFGEARRVVAEAHKKADEELERRCQEIARSLDEQSGELQRSAQELAQSICHKVLPT